VSFEKILYFLVQHNALIIESLIGLILVVIVYLSFRAFLSARQEELHPTAAGGADLSKIEEALKKILEQANKSVPAGTVASGDGAGLLAEIEKLKAELLAKQAEIEAARAGGAAGAGGAPGAPGSGPVLTNEEKATLEGKIKELQGKLAEYEIIAEDIADLSFFKEENAKLKKELDNMKSSAGAVVAAPAPAPAPAVAPADGAPPAAPVAAPPPEAPPATPVVAPTPEAPPTAPVVAPTPEAPPAAAPAEVAAAPDAPASVVDDDLMKEFAAAVEEQKQSSAPAAAPPPEAPPTAAPTEAPVSEPAPETAAPESAEPAAVDLGSMDMDKMLNEATVLKPDEAAPADPLSENLDADKLLNEASGMNAAGAKTEDEKIMGQFEDFVKKGT
jgi:hypothetical protein